MPLKLSTKVRSPSKAGGKMSKIFKAAFKDAQPKIAALIIDRVSDEANKVLRSMAPLYTEALNRPDSVKLTEEGIEISLGTKIAQAMEAGASAWDLKKAMLAKARKFSKSGVPYVDVPFKHSTSGARGATLLPSSVKRAIDARASSQRASGRGVQTTRMPAKKPGKKFTRKLLMGGKTKRQTVRHKHHLQSGLVRRHRPARGGKAASTSYSTVRRISANSNPSSWWHPGFKPAGILKKVLPKLKPEVTAILNDSLTKVTGGKQ